MHIRNQGTYSLAYHNCYLDRFKNLTFFIFPPLPLNAVVPIKQMIAGFAVDNDNEEGIDTLTSFEILSPFEKFKSNVESNSVFERQAAGRTLCEAVESCDTKDEFHCTMLYVARLSFCVEQTITTKFYIFCEIIFQR